MKHRYQKGRKKLRLMLLGILCFLIAAIYFTDTKLTPIIEAFAYPKIHSMAIKAMHQAAQKEIATNPHLQEYQSLMQVEKDAAGRIVLMMPNTMQINLLAASIALEFEKTLAAFEQNRLQIPLGILTGIKILAVAGPTLRVTITPVGIPHTQIKDEFITAGINQTRHRLWLEVSCEVKLALPFNPKTTTVSSQILLTEGIIIGPIPETYLNFK